MTCRKCGNNMHRNHHGNSNGRAVHHARGLCTNCYAVERRACRLDRWQAAERRRRYSTEADEQALIEDVEWMLETRSHPEWWAPRLGMSHAALARHLYEAGRNDLGAEVEQVRNIRRKQTTS